jgi:nucleoside phosphorylase
MILIFYALRRELGALRKRIGNRGALGDGLRGFKGRLGGEELFLVATGIGIAQARESARRALQILPRPRLVISTGVAGALSPDLKAGDLVIANRLLIESESGNYDEVAQIAPDRIQSARNALARHGLTAAAGAMLTARRVLSSPAAKRAAYARGGALAVDMESAAIAIELGPSAPPFLCIRAIIDEAGDEIPGADLADPSGQVSSLKAAAYFIRNPSALAQVPGILKNLRLATKSIASALEALCSPAT